MSSRANSGKASSGTSISPEDQLLNENSPASASSARRLLSASVKRIKITLQVTFLYAGCKALSRHGGPVTGSPDYRQWTTDHSLNHEAQADSLQNLARSKNMA